MVKIISSHTEACGNVKRCSQQDLHPVDPDRDQGAPLADVGIHRL